MDASPLTCPLASCGNPGVFCVDECVLVGGGVVMLPCVVWLTLPRSTLLTPSALMLISLCVLLLASCVPVPVAPFAVHS
jgi:hypothetical protein